MRCTHPSARPPQRSVQTEDDYVRPLSFASGRHKDAANAVPIPIPNRPPASTLSGNSVIPVMIPRSNPGIKPVHRTCFTTNSFL